MLLERCKDQPSLTLDQRFSPPMVSPEMSTAMRRLFSRIRQHQSTARAWGLTSLNHVVLLAEDNWQSPWYVKFVAASTSRYLVSYRLPESWEPWTRLSADTDNEDTAVAMIFQAMDLSGGWGPPPKRVQRATPSALTGPPMDLSPWPLTFDQPEIIERVRALPFPFPVRAITNGEDRITLTQGSPTFVTLYPDEVHCWVPPDEAPWPGSRYEAIFESVEQATELLRAAMQKWL